MITSESIIMSKRPLGEADLLVTFFSRDGGKIKGIARHAKKSRKRFGGTLETGYIVNLQYVQSPASELVRLDHASLVAPKVHLKPSLGDTYALYLALEFAGRYLPDAEPNRGKYMLLRRFLSAIHENRMTRPVLIFFLMKWIALSGYEPDIDQLPAEKGFDLDKGDMAMLKTIMKGEMDIDIKDISFEALLGFIFRYTMGILGKMPDSKTYLPMLMEL